MLLPDESVMAADPRVFDMDPDVRLDADLLLRMAAASSAY
jgi:hypothetical protein